MGYGDYQREVYALGQPPLFTMKVAELEALAREKLDPTAYNYVAGSASTEATARANRQAFDQWRLVPRMLRDCTERDTSITLFGHELPTPFLIAPIGVQAICHPDGEEAVARAAADQEVPFIYSCAATRTPEQVAAASGENHRWFQLYWPRDDDVTLRRVPAPHRMGGDRVDSVAAPRSYLKRARDNGYSTLVVTLDTFTIGFRPADLNQAYLPFLQGVGAQTGLSDPVLMRQLGREPFPDGRLPSDLSEDEAQEIVRGWIGTQWPNIYRTWKDVAFLRKHWKGPLVLKGIVSVDDARLAIQHGADGIVVSNHGGRQVDGARAALDALAAITADRVVRRSKLTVLFDSGVRSGADAMKALALGAKAVCIGRPYMWGLALEGEEGVVHVLRTLLADLDVTMGLAGVRTIAELGRDRLERTDVQPHGWLGRLLAKL